MIVIIIMNSTKHRYNQLGSPQIRGKSSFNNKYLSMTFNLER